MPMRNTCPRCHYGYRQRSANSRCPKCGYQMTAAENSQQAVLYLVVVIGCMLVAGLFKLLIDK